MVTQAYLFSKDKSLLERFASYEEGDELFSDRNISRGCVVKLDFCDTG